MITPFDIIAPFYALRILTITKDHDIIERNLDIEDGNVVLESGCGPLVYLLELSKTHNFTPIGVDNSLALLRIAGRRAEKCGSDEFRDNLQLVEADISKRTDFKDNYADRIIVPRTFMVIPNREGARDELYRILPPDGVMIVSEPKRSITGYVFGLDGMSDFFGARGWSDKRYWSEEGNNYARLVK